MTEIPEQSLLQIVQQFAQHLGIECVVSVQPGASEREATLVVMQTDADAKFLIGKNGQNLHALEQVLRAVQVRRSVANPLVHVDVNDYRKERARELAALASQAAERVRQTKKSEALEPMNAHERRIVHTELASWQDLATESVGAEPRRRVVIKPL